ncbi:hypothetical protein B0H17DRAFT_1126151 [Mycena rosella]|uniref:Uncharacterized protein n=1 Tax=Mycena rosella TaxID=1033263 RepID=A0AAD7GTY5_MYCRO|nr:hypothetical protein B0H17DRAFT_1126151 [Mycena rosella]
MFRGIGHLSACAAEFTNVKGSIRREHCRTELTIRGSPFANNGAGNPANAPPPPRNSRAHTGLFEDIGTLNLVGANVSSGDHKLSKNSVTRLTIDNTLRASLHADGDYHEAGAFDNAGDGLHNDATSLPSVHYQGASSTGGRGHDYRQRLNAPRHYLEYGRALGDRRLSSNGPGSSSRRSERLAWLKRKDSESRQQTMSTWKKERRRAKAKQAGQVARLIPGFAPASK